MYEALQQNNDEALKQLKLTKKAELFEEVADQCGELFDPAVFTLVFAKRFAGYKRADLFFHNQERLHKLLRNREHPIQIIWAGKPYPMDYVAIGVFDRLVELSKTYPNAVVLAGFGIKLSKLLKRGSDGWLNVPRLTHEASGTSGMAAAMNGSVNIGLPDGWFPEFAKHGVNSFVVQPCDSNLPEAQQDDQDAECLYDLLENTILPLYYNQPAQWLQVVKQGMIDILPQFDSKRMAAEYYSNSYVK
jgi:starch phosphorylase